MALHIQFRNGTAATWTSTNPVLSEGEVGDENDTGQFKIGDGVTTWNSLAYQSTTGPTQTASYRSFGDGSDGTVAVSAGTTTLSRDMYYNNLTMSGTGKIVTNGYKIFIKGILDISAAAVGAIQWNGNDGGNASGATGGAAGAAQAGGSVGLIATGGSGTTATTANGTAGGAGSIGNGNGGYSGVGGGGGTGTSGTGGTGSAARIPGINNPFRRYETNFLNGIMLVAGGTGGGGGGAGAGDGSNNGGGSGAGGNGGGLVAVYANIIVKSASTPAAVFQANGGMGGNGGNTAAGITGGGGGGGGGAGGWVYLAYNLLFGPVITGLLQANGGNGGNGGTATGSGATGGVGGNSGSGGRISIVNPPNGTSLNFLGNHDLVQQPEQVGYTPTVGITFLSLTGGGGGFNGLSSADL